MHLLQLPRAAIKIVHRLECRAKARRIELLYFFQVLCLGFTLSIAQAAEPNGNPSSGSSNSDRSQQSEEDDYLNTPFTQYGEFNEEENEAQETRFFQHGRFFGLSLGGGYQGVTGGRGLLYQGGFPVFDFKLHYWFDFNLALDLGFFTASHYVDTNVGGAGHIDINMVRFGVDLKYYFDTKDLSAPITAANPYILVGIGSLSKTQNYANQGGTTAGESSLALSGGMGLEFAISPRRTFFELEAKIHSARFQDTYTTLYQSVGIPNLTGVFYTVTGNILFVW